MVYINSKKYACESCIKGHRSSTCHHNDRPLFEIKKKGRPVSQCEKCREARQARRIHSKCTCDAEKTTSATTASGPGSTAAAASKKGKRFVPTVPSLPNGLKDALRATASTSEEGNDSRLPVDVLLNPCHCKDVWNCKCRAISSQSSSASRPSPPSTSAVNDGLSALALVASCCSPAGPSKASTSAIDTESAARLVPTGLLRNRTMSRSDCPHDHSKSPASSRSAQSAESSGSLRKTQHFAAPPADGSLTFRPVRTDRQVVDTNAALSPPSFPALAPSSATTPMPAMGSNCGCGQNCACAGCAMHCSSEDGTSTVPSHRANCAHDCPTCVDHDGGVELPGHKPQTTFLDQFFARAAALPSPPPTSSARSMSLDPTNVIVYPSSVFAAPTEGERDARGLAFGLVKVPKLECCGGRCSCPENTCACGTECSGCCVDDGETGGAGHTHRHVSPSTSFARRLPASAASSSRQ